MLKSFDKLGNYLLRTRDIEGMENRHKQVKGRINFYNSMAFPLNDAVIMTDRHNKITYWNGGAEKLYDIKSDEVLGSDLKDVFEEFLLFPMDRDNLMKTGMWQGESIHVKKTGEEICVSLSISALRDRNEVIGFYLVVRDVTGKRKMEEVLKKHRNYLDGMVKLRAQELGETNRKLLQEVQQRKKAEEELNLFFDLSIDAFIIADFNGSIIRVNPLFINSLGYEPDDSKGRSLHEVLEYIHQEDRENTTRALRDSVAECRTGYLENRVICKDGAYRWISWILNPYAEKGLVYVVGRDITEQKHMGDELTRLDRLNLVGEVAASIGHEVRNPMTTIRGFLQMIGNKEECTPYREYFDIMLEELDRANSIITEFLSLAKNKLINLRLKSLNSIVEAMYPLMEADAMMADKHINLELGGGLPDLYLDENEIRQLVLNLVRNGLEAMPSGGAVTISTFWDNSGVVLAIKDEGTGIDKELLDKLGTPFLTTKESGTGLGLAVCYSIAARHSAKIEIETNNNGTCFYVKFNKYK